MFAISLEGFADSVPFVDKLYNLEPVAGGYDIEPDAEAVKRLSHTVAIQDRAVSDSDLTVLIKNTGRDINKVKLLKPAAGGLDIIILPERADGFGDPGRQPEYFGEIKHAVMETLFEKGPVTLLSKARIKEARYIRYKINVDLTVQSYNDYHPVNEAVENALEAFLHPITGGAGRDGFEIGKMPTKTRIYMLLKAINKIVRINSFNINCFEIDGDRTKELDYEKAVLLDDAVPVSAGHDITIGLMPKREQHA